KNDSHKLCAKLSLNGFSCTISEVQNTGHSSVLAPRKLYEHGFMKKCDGHKLCPKSSFDRFLFHAPSRNFKILAITNVLAHRNSYEQCFTKNKTVINIVKVTLKSRVSIGFSRTLVEFQNTGHSQHIRP
ncbi:hypothetical protein GW17_00050672, partial [Ensete ventricosum]